MGDPIADIAKPSRMRRVRRLVSDWGLGGFALAGFFAVSVVATGLGFADLRAANTDAAQLSLLEIAFVGAVTLFVVSAMVASLNAALDQTRGGLMRLTAFVFYVFFAFWSVGFGFGFFWKELAGQEFTEAQFETSISNAAGSVAAAADALTTVEASVADAAGLARGRAELEAKSGGTCANRPNSPPGDGPLTRSRFAFAARADAIAEEVAQSWTSRLAPAQQTLARRLTALSTGVAPRADVSAEEAERLTQLASAAALSPSAREAVFTSTYNELREFVADANALRARNADAYAERLDGLAREVGPDPARPGRADPARLGDASYCWDVVLSDRLFASAAALRALDDIPAPEFEFLEGPKATRAAFFNLARFAGGGWRRGDQTFGDKEFVALFASLAVDLGILILTLLRAPRRNQSTAAARAHDAALKMRDTATQLAPLPPARMNALIHRHIVSHGRARYLAVPIQAQDGSARQDADALSDLALLHAGETGVRGERKWGLRALQFRHNAIARAVGAANGVRLYRLSPEAEIALKLVFQSGEASAPPPPAPLDFSGLAG